MVDHEPFLASIRDAPDDVAPRLVYADFLDETGEPDLADRAEFIRLQCELDEVAPFDPRREALGARQRELFLRYEELWLQPFRPILTFHRPTTFGRYFRAKDGEGIEGRIAAVWFARGFPEAVGLPARRFLQHIEAVFAAGPIRQVGMSDLGHLQNADLVRLGSHPLWARVRALVLNYNPAADNMGVLLCESPGLAKLETLEIKGVRLPAADFRRLARADNLPRLAHLYAGGVAVMPSEQGATGNDLAATLAAGPLLARLRTLDLGRMALTERGLRSLVTPPSGGLLEDLDLSDNNFANADPELLRRVLSLPRLAALHLTSCGLGASLIETLSGWSGPAYLTHLSLARNKLSAEAVRALANAAPLAGLVRLDLSHTRLGREAVRALAESPYLQSLRRLDLVSCGLDAAARCALRERFGDACRLDRPAKSSP